MNYLYDETFEGFLTCVYYHYYREKADGIFPASSYQLDLTRQQATIAMETDKADRVYAAICEKLSPWDMERIYRVFRTDTPEKEKKLLNYIRLGFKHGGSIRLLHAHPIVAEVERAERKLGTEVHRLCGLIRFSVVKPAAAERGVDVEAEATTGLSRIGQDILYAAVEPDHDVVEFLAPHFADRFKYDPFIIHDQKRGKALLAYGGQWYVTAFSGQGILENTEAESRYRGLWRHYFDTIAIKERTNPRCQRNFMPLRYWKNLTEVNNV